MAYPETIAKINFIPQFFSMLFFIMLFVLGIGSNIGMTSCVMTVTRDRFPHWKCWKIVLAISFVGVSVGCIYTTPGGQFIINFLDFYGASFVALILAIVELITVGWIYGVDRFCKDVEFMLGKKTGIYWRLCWGIVTPLLMFSIFIYFVSTWTSITYQGYEYHPTMHSRSFDTNILSPGSLQNFFSAAFGWCISLFCLLQLPIWAFYAIINQREKTWRKRIVNAFMPNSMWGPNDVEKSIFFSIDLVDENNNV